MKTIIAAAVLALTSSVFGASIGVVTIRGEVGGRNAELTAAAVKQWTYSGNTVTDLGQLTEYVQQAASVDDVFARLFRERGIRFCVRHKVVAAEGGYTYGIQLTDCKTLETIVSKSVNCENLDSAFRAAVSSIGKDIVAAVAAVPDADATVRESALKNTPSAASLKTPSEQYSEKSEPAAGKGMLTAFQEAKALLSNNAAVDLGALSQKSMLLSGWEKDLLYSTSQRHIGSAIFLNLLPIPIPIGIGSFIQGDYIGGTILLVESLSFFSTILILQFSFQQPNAPITDILWEDFRNKRSFFTIVTVSCIGCYVISSVLIPLLFSVPYNSSIHDAIFAGKRSSHGPDIKLHPIFSMDPYGQTYGLAMQARF